MKTYLVINPHSLQHCIKNIKMIDLTNYRELQEPTKTRTILTCYVRLDKKTMLNALQSDGICINGEYFKVPEHTLLECLINRRYGETRLELEKIG